jgi:predicted RND superfamily exporter protein
MAPRIFRLIAFLSLKHSVPVLVLVAAASVVLGFNIRNLRLITSLTELFGQSNPQWEAVNKYTRHSGYGNQLFVIVESKLDAEDAYPEMEAIADRLVEEMETSGYFSSARCRLEEEELLRIVRLFAWNFPSYLSPDRLDAVRERLSENGIKDAVARGRAGLVTAFSRLGSDYFVADPLGLTEFLAPIDNATALFDMDLSWGSGNYFYSKDHTALLILAEPEPSGMNYQLAQDLLQWTRERCAILLQSDEYAGRSLRLTAAGAPVYAEQDRNFIEKNIGLVSSVSVIANLILCLFAYRRMPIFLLSFVPTFLGLVWTTGIIGFYPGALNLISLSFIAILVGLGDDNVVHFFNRVPQEWTGGNTLYNAMARTIETTGRSIFFCILTTGTATLALTTAEFKGLSEFGFVLTIGLLMLLFHSLITVPAVMYVWWRIFPPHAPESTTFRFFPSVAAVSARFVSRHSRSIFGAAVLLLAAALLLFPFLRMDRKIQMERADDSPAVIGERMLAEKFRIAGTPGLILIQGKELDVLNKAEKIAAAVEDLKDHGVVQSVFSPTAIIPSPAAQRRRLSALSTINLDEVAMNLERALAERGFKLEYFRPSLDNLRAYSASDNKILTADEVLASLPEGLLDNSIHKIGENQYLAAVAYYSSNENGMDVIPEKFMAALQKEYGPFIEFSYPKLNRELQQQIFRDNRKALLLTFLGIVLIVFLCFRSLRMTLLVLFPILFAVCATFALLTAAKHNFSFMALTAIPLITGLGIDNGIHLARRFREKDKNDIIEIMKNSGAALMQSNLTTILGFGALTVSTFEPLAELGLVTAIGVGFTLLGAMLLIPSMVIVFRIRP